MKLSEYVVALCQALEAEDTNKQSITMTLLHEHLPHRKQISRALQDMLLGKAMAALDALFDDVQVVLKCHNDYKEAHQASIKELEDKVDIHRNSFEALDAAKSKPKRTIRKAPQGGNIEQERLDAAMQDLRKRRAEKKSAQKAKKDE